MQLNIEKICFFALSHQICLSNNHSRLLLFFDIKILIFDKFHAILEARARKMSFKYTFFLKGKIMKNKILLLVPILGTSLAASSLSDNTIAQFTENNPGATLEKICAFVQEHEQNGTLCNKIRFVLKLRKGKTTTEFEWENILKQGQALIERCNNNAETADAQKWQEILGLPFSEIILQCGQQTGIHGSVQVKFDAHKKLPTGKMMIEFYKDTNCKKEAWLAIQHLIANFINLCTQAKNEPGSATKLASLGGIMQFFGTNSDIKMRLSLENNQDKLYVCFANTKNQ